LLVLWTAEPMDVVFLPNRRISRLTHFNIHKYQLWSCFGSYNFDYSYIHFDLHPSRDTSIDFNFKTCLTWVCWFLTAYIPQKREIIWLGTSISCAFCVTSFLKIIILKQDLSYQLLICFVCSRVLCSLWTVLGIVNGFP
jgi:hypothetical protein